MAIRWISGERMSEKRYVQHVSGKGETYRVIGEVLRAWSVVMVGDTALTNWNLPKVDYLLCDPPEQWVDVTAEITIDRSGRHILHTSYAPYIVEVPSGYRLSKMQLFHRSPASCDYDKYDKQWAFIVERKEQP